ncbi:UbiD family decarboxylase [archaeon]|nr:MAG: UbiD family decarboxylase [archaeon]
MTDLRSLLSRLDREGRLTRIRKDVDPFLTAASIASALDGRAVLFENVRGHEMPVVAGIGSHRDHYASALGVGRDDLLGHIAAAFDSNGYPPEIDDAPCKERIDAAPSLDRLPILTHFKGDGGPYITSGVAVVRDPELGQNLSFHRLMKIGKNRLVARIVEGRGTHTALVKSGGELDIAICIGAPLHVLLAAACSPPPGHDELRIASALAPTPVVRAEGSDLLVPAQTEIVLEGRITSELADEGPFVDLTQTPDVTRRQHVVEIDTMTTRNDPYYHALMPASDEHKLLMGMPREPSIFHAVGRAADVRNVVVTPGGCSWLHAVVQIAPKREGDAMRAAKGAFEGHGSLKHCVVVDTDVDVYDPADIEWALATRVQAGRDVKVFKDRPGSSLDPSAFHEEGKKSRTDKVAIDATVPRGADDGAYRKVRYAPVDLDDYLE